MLGDFLGVRKEAEHRIGKLAEVIEQKLLPALQLLTQSQKLTEDAVRTLTTEVRSLRADMNRWLADLKKE